MLSSRAPARLSSDDTLGYCVTPHKGTGSHCDVSHPGRRLISVHNANCHLYFDLYTSLSRLRTWDGRGSKPKTSIKYSVHPYITFFHSYTTCCVGRLTARSSMLTQKCQLTRIYHLETITYVHGLLKVSYVLQKQRPT